MEKDLKKAVERFCPDIDERVRDDFLSRMDPEYLSLYSPEEIATHLRMSYRLDSQHPVQSRVIPRGDGIFDIVIVAYDYFSELSILCGLLACFGLDIQSGHIYTFSEKGRGAGRDLGERPSKTSDSRKKIVDLFRVRLIKGEVFDEARQNEFERELQGLILLLDQDHLQEARAQINRRFVEYLSRKKGDFMGPLYPVEVRFDNRLSEKWTVMGIRSKDTPAFLYAFINALSMRGIYIHKVRIENIGSEVQDQIYLSDRQGRKIGGTKEQDLLRIATVMIKLFTHFLVRAPDPAMAITHFDQLLDKIVEDKMRRSVLALLSKRGTLDLLARLLGASEFLWEDFLRMQFENLLPILQDFRKAELLRDKEQMRRQLRMSLARGRTLEDKKRILNEFKDREMFRIDMRHLLEPPADLMDFSRALTELAEVVLDQAYEICHTHLTRRYGQPLLENHTVCPFAICGLGKFGGREMGYASDLEVLFVYGGPGRTQSKVPIENGDYFERLCQEIINSIEARREGMFQIDVRLRPYGKAGVLANSMEQLGSYYSPKGEAAPFERQALTKLRPVAGDQTLGRQIESIRDAFVYSDEPWDLQTALHLRRRQMNELVNPGTVNVKYSPGGVIDLEYAVQYLQIMYGRRHPGLRTTSTLEALEGLYRVWIISQEEWDRLREAYLFLRALIDALRIVRGNARDLVLPDRDSDEIKYLARRMGFSGPDWDQSAQKLADEIHLHMENAHHFFVSRFEKA